MKIGIVKPDYKISGGFEVVVNRLKLELEKLGHEVTVVYVDATDRTIKDIPYSLTNEMVQSNPVFFEYINNYWKYMKLDVSRFDCVISTQPPSFAIKHPRHISLFYHHMKIFYDMSDLIQEVGLQQPYHQKAADIIREIDTHSLANVTTILAGSKTIKERIRKFNGLEDNVDIVYAGISEDIYNFDGSVDYEYPIIVGRHEFPKRPELFLAAMKKIPSITGKVIGAGGRTEDLKKIDQILTHASQNNIEIDDDSIWKKMSNGNFSSQHNDYYKQSKKLNHASNVIFTGRISDSDLINEYSKASCVVCPAYEEDYGLTAIEAMSFKKAVIACKDGGGYAEVIVHGVNGFLVDPSSEAIAEAIFKLSTDKKLAERMGKAAYETSRSYTWKNTMKTINKYLN